jgi:short-subunit dehydrogenase
METHSATPDPQPTAETRVALVAGASRGLGLLIARELGQRGHHVVICARDEIELDSAQDLLGEAGIAVSTRVCDVTDRAAVRALVADVEDTVGPIHTAITVAGVIHVGPLESVTEDHFAEAVDIMLWGPVHVALAVLPGMRKRRAGRIGTVTSIGGLVSVPHLLPYSTAKFGAVGFSTGLRSELAGTGVKVTTVVPGLMRTGSHLRAEFTGQQGAEYAWFAPSATLPLIAMDPERAANRIVDGVLAGRAYVLLSLLTKVGSRVNGLAPTTTAALLGLAARLLPSGPPPSGTDTVQGYQVEERLRPLPAALTRVVTTLGRRSADRWNQRPAR